MSIQITRCLLFAGMLIVALTSCSGGKTPVGRFNYNTRITGKKDTYLVMNDGRKIYGSRVDFERNKIGGAKIGIDGVVYQTGNVKGYMSGGMYFARYDANEYIKRIVTGKKLEIFVNIREQDVVYGNGQTLTAQTRFYLYRRAGEDVLTRLRTQNQLIDLVSDCADARLLAEKKGSGLNAAIRNNPDYMNEIVDRYNECGGQN